MARDFISFSSSPSLSLVKNGHERLNGEKKQLTDYHGIISNNPFGIKSEDYSSLQDSSLPSSSSEVILLGTFSGEKGTGYAVFSDAGREQKVFRIGERVFNIGTLERVAPYSVIVRGDRDLEIPLVDIDTLRRSQTGPRGVNYKRNSPRSQFIQRTTGNSFVVDGRKVEEAIENPQQLMVDARLQPRFVKGKQEGFMLREVKRGGIYDQLGMKNGDVLLSINQYDITDPEVALQAFAALRGANNIQLDVMRGGKRLSLNYLIR